MRQRARQAFEAKIQRGHGMWEVPVGFIRTRDNRSEKIADRQVQHASAGVFQKCRELGSARQTMLWYREAQLPLPECAIVTVIEIGIGFGDCCSVPTSCHVPSSAKLARPFGTQ